MNYSNNLSDSTVAIFLLHGVIHEQTHFVRNYTKKHITRDFFYAFLHDLSQRGSAISMDAIITCITEKKPFPKKAFSITFDDGFENNVSIALPLLRQFQIPATFYVTTDFIDRNKMSWIDRIEYAVELSMSGEITLGSNVLSFCNDFQSKRIFLDAVRAYLKKAHLCNLNAVATDIQHQLNIAPVDSSSDPLDKKMSWEQVSQLQQDPLCTIGAHTHTHPILSHLNDIDARQEIMHSLAMIRQHVGIRCHHFSYPEGLSNCYSDREITILKNNNVVCSPSAEHGVNTLSSNLFHLKRIMVS